MEGLGCSLDPYMEGAYWASNCVNGNTCVIEHLSDYSEATLCHYFYELGISAPESNNMENLMDDLLYEMNRAREVLTHYEAIPEGVFGAMMIKANIKAAENSIKEGDVVAMLVCYKDLKEIQ